MTSKCVECGREFKPGEYLQAFLRSPEDPKGSWTEGVRVDEGYQERSLVNQDTIRRRHVSCKRL